jgi:hypothetical protein
MPWYGFIHPILALATFGYGMRAAQVSVSKLRDWNFPLRRQRTRSTIFFLLCVANLVLGFLATLLMRGRGMKDFTISAHLPLAMATIVLALAASLVTFGQPKRPGELPPVMRLHPMLLVVAGVLILTMVLLGLLKAFGM